MCAIQHNPRFKIVPKTFRTDTSTSCARRDGVIHAVQECSLDIEQRFPDNVADHRPSFVFSDLHCRNSGSYSDRGARDIERRRPIVELKAAGCKLDERDLTIAFVLSRER